jgi:hypothetical protein
MCSLIKELSVMLDTNKQECLICMINIDLSILNAQLNLCMMYVCYYPTPVQNW